MTDETPLRGTEAASEAAIANAELRQSQAQQAAIKSGYARGNCDDWYPAGPGVPEIPRRLNLEVRIEARVKRDSGRPQDSWPVALYGREYATARWFLMSRYETWNDFMAMVRDLETTSRLQPLPIR
jgi:hypothetical protein